ncbi:hypothetical protein M426DRAFT_27742 [Hypoxylon sp. CI-4A]|nr:hypothetical protein M426DRAFT_27742 [Hypoxylon sp. CI-4A]
MAIHQCPQCGKSYKDRSWNEHLQQNHLGTVCFFPESTLALETEDDDAMVRELLRLNNQRQQPTDSQFRCNWPGCGNYRRTYPSEHNLKRHLRTLQKKSLNSRNGQATRGGRGLPLPTQATPGQQPPHQPAPDQPIPDQPIPDQPTPILDNWNMAIAELNERAERWIRVGHMMHARDTQKDLGPEDFDHQQFEDDVNFNMQSSAYCASPLRVQTPHLVDEWKFYMTQEYHRRDRLEAFLPDASYETMASTHWLVCKLNQRAGYIIRFIGFSLGLTERPMDFDDLEPAEHAEQNEVAEQHGMGEQAAMAEQDATTDHAEQYGMTDHVDQYQMGSPTEAGSAMLPYPEEQSQYSDYPELS